MFDRTKNICNDSATSLLETFVTEITKKTENDLVDAVITLSARVGIKLNEEKVKELLMKSQKLVPPSNIINEKMVFFCPACSKVIKDIKFADASTIPSYCDKCGQALDFDVYKKIAKHCGGVSNEI